MLSEKTKLKKKNRLSTTIKKREKKGWRGVAQVVEYLPSKCRTPRKSQYHHQKKEEEEEEEEEERTTFANII
jgi:hypothetical protein